MDEKQAAYWRKVFGPDVRAPFENIDWAEELRRESELRKTLSQMEGAPVGTRRKAARAWFEQASRVLRICTFNSRSGMLEIEAPGYLFATVAKLFDHLGRGIIPSPISEVSGRGRPRIGPDEERHIAWASAYINGARIGEIEDPHPVKTIGDAYGVERQVAQRWAGARLPESLGVGGYSAENVKLRMLEAARIYRNAGRAIGERSEKQRKHNRS